MRVFLASSPTIMPFDVETMTMPRPRFTTGILSALTYMRRPGLLKRTISVIRAFEASLFIVTINITSIDFLDSGNLVYGVKKGDGYLVKTLDLNTKKTKELTTLPMTEWTLENVGGSVLRAYYKPTMLMM
jgi:hypothetical protein